MEIVYYPNPILRQKSVLIEKNQIKDIKQLVKHMYKTMKDKRGIGLSAVQVGIPIQLFLCQERFFINPLIISFGNRIIYNDEGCLSVPGKKIKVGRPDEILLEYTNRKWIRKREKIKGLDAIICQHEIDHLNGKLILDYDKEN